MDSNLIYGFLSGVPVAALLMFMFGHLVKNRDSFEKQTAADITTLQFSISKLDKQIAEMRKDIEYMGPMLRDLCEKVSKLKEGLIAARGEC